MPKPDRDGTRGGAHECDPPHAELSPRTYGAGGPAAPCGYWDTCICAAGKRECDCWRVDAAGGGAWGWRVEAREGLYGYQTSGYMRWTSVPPRDIFELRRAGGDVPGNPVELFREG